MNILIAEDSPIIQLVHREMMSAWGYSCDIVGNGAEAVACARRNEGLYDLCLMDVSMPTMGGVEATRIMRRDLGYFPIVGYSSNLQAVDECLASGMDEFLLKPAPPEQLQQVIGHLSVKVNLVKINNETVTIVRATPMNAEELKELMDLKARGLTKLKLVGLDRAFVVHRNVQNKISHDLVGEGKEISEFIDRSPDEPGRCHLYKANLNVTKDLFLPDELEEAVRREDQVVEQLVRVVDRRVQDN